MLPRSKVSVQVKVSVGLRFRVQNFGLKGVYSRGFASKLRFGCRVVRFGGRIEDVGYILTHRGGRILVRGMVWASVRRSGVDLWFGLRFGSGVASGLGAVVGSRIGGRWGHLLFNLFDTLETLILIVKGLFLGSSLCWIISQLEGDVAAAAQPTSALLAGTTCDSLKTPVEPFSVPLLRKLTKIESEPTRAFTRMSNHSQITALRSSDWC